MQVTYNGKTVETKFYEEVSDELMAELREAFYRKPPKEKVFKQLQSIAKGGVKINLINKYYYRDLQAKVKLSHSKWSIEEAFESKDIMGIFYGKVLDNDKVFPKDKELIANIETAIRLGGKGFVAKATNFPIKYVREIISLYNVNNNYYDPSCGWGDRLLGALSMGVNYFGTDPNYMLVDRLNQIANDYACANNTKSNVDIKAHGSEIFIPEYENKMGLVFTSPPYFDLEDYKVGKQSYNENVSYDQWLRNFIVPTFKNIKRYLVEDGYFALNIKNQKKYKMLDDCIELAKVIGFKLHDVHELKNIKRCHRELKHIDNDEKIVVFKLK